MMIAIRMVSSSNVNVTAAVGSFKSELNTLFCDGLSVGGAECGAQYGIQNFISSLHEDFETGTEDVTDVVNQMMDRVDDALNVRAGFLYTMAEAINTSCFSYRWGIYSEEDSLADSDGLHFAGNADQEANLPSDMLYNSIYGEAVSLTKSTYRVPNNVDYTDELIMNDAAVSLLLEQTMVELHDEYCVDELSGFVLLFFTVSPVLARACCLLLVVQIGSVFDFVYDFNDDAYSAMECTLTARCTLEQSTDSFESFLALKCPPTPMEIT